MTEEKGTIKNLIQQRIDKLDEKSNCIMALAGVLIIFDIAIVLGISNTTASILVFIELLFLFNYLCLILNTEKLNQQRIPDIVDTFNRIERIDYIQDTGDLSITISPTHEIILIKTTKNNAALK